MKSTADLSAHSNRLHRGFSPKYIIFQSFSKITLIFRELGNNVVDLSLAHIVFLEH